MVLVGTDYTVEKGYSMSNKVRRGCATALFCNFCAHAIGLPCKRGGTPMRFIGLILALGAIGWTLYRIAGGGEAETAVPATYQKSIDAAKGLEQAVQQASQNSIETAEGN